MANEVALMNLHAHVCEKILRTMVLKTGSFRDRLIKAYFEYAQLPRYFVVENRVNEIRREIDSIYASVALIRDPNLQAPYEQKLQIMSTKQRRRLAECLLDLSIFCLRSSQGNSI